MSYRTHNPREAGILIPLWTLSHDGDFGIGDIKSLRTLLPWIQKSGLKFVQLLPINEADNTNSPYSAISSIAIDPIYLDLSLIPGIPAPEESNIEDEERDFVDYPRVRASKDSLLREAFNTYVSLNPNDPPFMAFKKQEEDWLPSYSLYRWLMHLEGNNPNWNEWSEDYNTPEKAWAWLESKLATNEEHNANEMLYFEWLQWHCYMQWKSLRKEADTLDVKLMGDIPVGVSYNSADVFFEPENFDLNWFGGAPPETFFKDDDFAVRWGQNWGVPLYNDSYLHESNFAWWRRRVKKHVEIFSMFRIDHILGMYRFYSFPWPPSRNDDFLHLSDDEAKELTGGKLPQFLPSSDDTEEGRNANLARGKEFISIIQEAAGTSEIIAEDLGATPDYVRPHLEEVKIAGFRVCQWEANQETGIPLATELYPYYSFATFATHDHPPFRALWEEARTQALDRKKRDNESAKRTLQTLLATRSIPPSKPIEIGRKVPAYDEALLWHSLDYLFKTNSKYAGFMITDLLSDDVRFNTPSTVGDHNWTYRIYNPVEEFYTDPELVDIQKELATRIALFRSSPAIV